MTKRLLSYPCKINYHLRSYLAHVMSYMHCKTIIILLCNIQNNIQPFFIAIYTIKTSPERGTSVGDGRFSVDDYIIYGEYRFLVKRPIFVFVFRVFVCAVVK